MAITAAMTLSSATSKAEQPVTATCTVTNTGSVAVNVLAIVPTAPIHSGTAGNTAVSLGMPPIGGAFATSVPGSSGTLAISWPVVAHAPGATSTGSSLPAEPASLVYDIGATVYTSDGAVTAATTTTLTVSPPSGL